MSHLYFARRVSCCVVCVWLLIIALSLVSAVSMPSCCFAANAAASAISPEDLRKQAIAELREVLVSQPRWIKIHAAEALLELGYPQQVSETIRDELETHGAEPQYRIGIWRVLARVPLQERERQAWILLIRDAFLDRQGADRVHAVESLAKLDYRIPLGETEPFSAAAGSTEDALALFAAWVVANQGESGLEDRIVRRLQAPDPVTRLRAAFVLQELPYCSAEVRKRLLDAARKEPAESIARTAMIAAAYVRAREIGNTAKWANGELHRLASEGDAAAKRSVALAYAEQGARDELDVVCQLLSDADPDVRTAAALAAMRILRREHRRLGRLDWIVIAGYACSMVAVGWYCSRRAATTEDYLLGGRTMKPWAVGLSLFATLLSTITYLAIPGEMIRHGPMIMSQILVFPFIMLVVGWLLIPRFMQLEATSAYELLETRLGLTVRLMGATFFLAMRLFWMAVIIHATTTKVLIPLLGWQASEAPWVSAVLGTITVVYTSLGGFRAVVITDVIQTMVLLGGAVLTMVLITVDLGGVFAWWPDQWAATWDPPKFWFDPGSRATVATVSVSVFTWHVCTAGSDQMAVQRYLSTRDVPAARRMFGTSLGVNAIALVFLALLGLALLSFFRAHPNLLGDGQTIVSNADQLLPRFIMIGLPQGVSGLVVAALIAAAMSSLSSGVNSSCSIIAVDFIDRFRSTNETVRDPLRRARRISWIVGATVVLFSSAGNLVQGNLLEVTFRVVNLLVAPLFVLFFLAMFVPWANSLGGVVAGVASVATAVAIAFFDVGGLSFLWGMPASLVVGIVTGMLVSLLPLRSPLL